MDRGAVIRRRLLTVALVAGVFGAALVLVMGLAFFGVLSRILLPCDTCRDDHSALATALAWCQLAELPDTAEVLSVDVAGSEFTREFTITFRAPVDDVRGWLVASPGIDLADIPADEPTYTLTPVLKGAVFGEVIVDEFTGTVTIHTYWS